MKDKLTILFATITFILCIYLGPSSPKISRGIDPKIKSYVTRFEQEAKKQVGNCWNLPSINIVVGDTRFADPFSTGDYRIVGLCNYLTGNMIIDDFVFTFSKAAVEEVVFHELGHCVLNRDHTERWVNETTPASIMYPIMIPENIYLKYREYYMIELFAYTVCR